MKPSRRIFHPPAARTARFCELFFPKVFYSEHLASVITEMQETRVELLVANEPTRARWAVVGGHLILAATILKHPVVAFVRGLFG